MTNSNHPKYARLATKLLAERAPPLNIDSLGDRAQTVATLGQALARRKRGRIMRRMAVAAVVGVSVLLFGRAVLHHRDDRAPTTDGRTATQAITATVTILKGTGATVERAGAIEVLVDRARLLPGDRLRSENAEVEVALSSGTRLSLVAGADINVVTLQGVQRLMLRRGRLLADVAKLLSAQRFLIETPDAEVEVKGTSFEVAVAPQAGCADGIATQVEVFRGLVEVRRGRIAETMAAGQISRADCATPRAQDSTPTGKASPSPERSQVRRTRALKLRERIASVIATSRADSSTLAEQNNLFAVALEARRQARFDEAVATLDHLLARFPGGPLSESARSERAQIVRLARPAKP